MEISKYKILLSLTIYEFTIWFNRCFTHRNGSEETNPIEEAENTNIDEKYTSLTLDNEDKEKINISKERACEALKILKLFLMQSKNEKTSFLTLSTS